MRSRKRTLSRARPSTSSLRHSVTPSLSRYDLYELCVQDAARMAPFLAAVHGGRARVLREDFSGSGGVCRAWVGLGKGYRAVAVDEDAEPLRLLRGVRGVKGVRADVMTCRERADVVCATNFPIGYWHSRRELVRYLRGVRASLRPGGVFVCDTYGGATAFAVGTVVRDHWLPGGRRVRYTWEQREADPLTGLVLDVLHFRVERGERVLQDFPEAFTYWWRLWSVPEVREAMGEVGFDATEVYAGLADAVDGDGRVYVRPVADPGELGDSFVVQVAGRV